MIATDSEGNTRYNTTLPQPLLPTRPATKTRRPFAP